MDVLENQFRGFFQEQGEGGVEDIGGGETIMEISRQGADGFSHIGQKGDDIMFRHLLYFVDPVDIKGRPSS